MVCTAAGSGRHSGYALCRLTDVPLRRQGGHCDAGRAVERSHFYALGALSFWSVFCVRTRERVPPWGVFGRVRAAQAGCGRVRRCAPPTPWRTWGPASRRRCALWRSYSMRLCFCAHAHRRLSHGHQPVRGPAQRPDAPPRARARCGTGTPRPSSTPVRRGPRALRRALRSGKLQGAAPGTRGTALSQRSADDQGGLGLPSAAGPQRIRKSMAGAVISHHCSWRGWATSHRARAGEGGR